MKLTIHLTQDQFDDLIDALDVAQEGYADKIDVNDIYTYDDICTMQRQQALCGRLLSRLFIGRSTRAQEVWLNR